VGVGVGGGGGGGGGAEATEAGASAGDGAVAGADEGAAAEAAFGGGAALACGLIRSVSSRYLDAFFHLAGKAARILGASRNPANRPTNIAKRLSKIRVVSWKNVPEMSTAIAASPVRASAQNKRTRSGCC